MAKGKNVLLDPSHPGYDEAIPREELAKLIELLRLATIFPEGEEPRITDVRITVEGRVVRRVPDGIAILASGATPGKLSFAPGVIPGRDGFSFAGGTSGDEGPGGDVYLGTFCVIQGAQQKVKLAAVPTSPPQFDDAAGGEPELPDLTPPSKADDILVRIEASARIAYIAVRATSLDDLPPWEDLPPEARDAMLCEAKGVHLGNRELSPQLLGHDGFRRMQLFERIVLACMDATA